MYRIISGKQKGKKIAAPKNFEVRPTTDFAKEGLFSMISHRYDIAFISVLDLFSGIGSISFEFASRETKDITSVDLNPKHSAFVHETSKELGFDSQIRMQRADVFEFLKRKRNQGKLYDLVFADPPFDLPREKYEDLVKLVLDKEILGERGVFILEHQTREKMDELPGYVETRKFSNVSFSFFSLAAASTESPE